MNNRFSRTVTALILTFAIAVAPVLPLSAYAADASALATRKSAPMGRTL